MNVQFNGKETISIILQYLNELLETHEQHVFYKEYQEKHKQYPKFPPDKSNGNLIADLIEQISILEQSKRQFDIEYNDVDYEWHELDVLEKAYLKNKKAKKGI